MEGSRCQRLRQMWSSSLSPQMNEKWNNSHRAQLNTSRGPWKSERTRKLPALQGRTKERRKKKRRGRGLGPATLQGDESEERSPYPRKPLIGGAQFGQKESLILCGKRPWQTVCRRRTEWDLHTGCWPQPCPPSLSGMSSNADKGWLLKCGVWRADPGRGLRFAVRIHPEGTEVREEVSKGMLLEEAWTTIERVSFLSDAQGMSPLHPLSLVPAPASQGLGRTLPSLGSFEPQPWPPPSTSSIISRILSSGAASGEDTCELATCTDGAESTGERQQ